MTSEELKNKSGLSGEEKLTADELDMILELEEENARRGNFTKIFPLATNV
jgi:D-alanyl-D-alanine carboxypeptidase